MIDLLLALVGVVLAGLLVGTAYAAAEYNKQLKKVRAEYEKARNAVDDIVLSFNREIKQEANKIERLTLKFEDTTAKAETGLRQTDVLEKRILPFESQLNQFREQISAQNKNMEAIGESSTIEVGKVADIEAKLQLFEVAKKELESKISALQEQVQKLPAAVLAESPSEQGMPMIPVIPIKRDKAIAALTETEVTVLEFLAVEGPKAGPEIREKVQLSREHTARLMKKLYEEGYLERETAKLPFKYHVKEEMRKLLKKTEAPPPNSP